MPNFVRAERACVAGIATRDMIGNVPFSKPERQ